MTTRPVIWILCAGAIALACAPHSHHNESAAATLDEQRPPLAPHADSTAIPLGAHATVAVGHRVTLALRITNHTDHKLEVDFPNGQTHDFLILDAAGHAVWRWGQGRMFTQAVRNTFLDAGEGTTYQGAWTPTGMHGHFTAVAILKSSNHPLEKRVPFTLP